MGGHGISRQPPPRRGQDTESERKAANMAVIINYYTDENKHEYQCSYWGRDGLYIKAIKGNFYIFYNRKYLGKNESIKS